MRGEIQVNDKQFLTIFIRNVGGRLKVDEQDKVYKPVINSFYI